MVADAIWVRMDGSWATAYFILLRSVHGDTAVCAVSTCQRGGETVRGWRAAIRALPRKVASRIVGATIDGNGGLETALKELGEKHDHSLVIQRCQFHCLAEYLRRLGKKNVKWDRNSASAWSLGYQAITAPTRNDRNVAQCLLSWLSSDPTTSTRVRSSAHWFGTQIPAVTQCYTYERCRLPNTTGSAEATCKRMRQLLTRIRPRSMQRLRMACALFPRLFPSVHCETEFAPTYIIYPIEKVGWDIRDDITVATFSEWIMPECWSSMRERWFSALVPSNDAKSKRTAHRFR